MALSAQNKKKILNLLRSQTVLTASFDMEESCVYYKKVMSEKNGAPNFENDEAAEFVYEMNNFLSELYCQAENHFFPRVFFSASPLQGLQITLSAGSETGIFLYGSNSANCGIAHGVAAREAMVNFPCLCSLLSFFIDHPNQSVQQILQAQRENLGQFSPFIMHNSM